VAVLAELVSDQIAGAGAQGGRRPSRPWVPSAADSAPLSHAQRRFWNLERLRPNNVSLNYVWAGKVDGPVDLTLLGKAIARAADRHPSTGTRFTPAADPRDATQTVDLTPAVGLDHHPHACASAEDAAEVAEALALVPFDLSGGRLLRASWVPIEGGSGLLVLNGHVIVSDGWSKELLLAEIETQYRRTEEGEDCPLALEATPRFLDFALAERAFESAARHTKRIEYWRTRILGAVRPALPYDHAPRPPINQSGAWVTSSRFTDANRLSRSALRAGATLNAFLLGCFAWAVRRWSGLDRFPVLVPAFNRPTLESQAIVGCFTETLLVGADLEERDGLEGAITAMSRALAEAIEDPIPFELLLDELGMGDERYDPDVFPIMFAPQPDLGNKLRLDAATVSQQELAPTASIMNLHAFVTVGEVAAVRFNYSTGAFRASSVERLAAIFHDVVEEAAE
jgi:condensation domain-containing protein